MVGYARRRSAAPTGHSAPLAAAFSMWVMSVSRFAAPRNSLYVTYQVPFTDAFRHLIRAKQGGAKRETLGEHTVNIASVDCEARSKEKHHDCHCYLRCWSRRLHRLPWLCHEEALRRIHSNTSLKRDGGEQEARRRLAVLGAAAVSEGCGRLYRPASFECPPARKSTPLQTISRPGVPASPEARSCERAYVHAHMLLRTRLRFSTESLP